MVALRNYSGHDTPVSNPVVNEKGIVVSITLQLPSRSFPDTNEPLCAIPACLNSRAGLRHVHCMIACRYPSRTLHAIVLRAC